MEPKNGAAPAPPAENDNGALMDAIGNLTSAVTTLTTRMEETPPLRSLEPNDPPPTTPQITVRSRYDDVSLFGLLVHDTAARLDAARLGKPYRRTEEFMRSLVDKTRQAHEEDQKHPPTLRSAYFPAVDTEAYNAWTEKVPYLRANEAMQSTLATSGDELVPELLSSVAHYEFRLESRVLGLLPSFQMPSQPYDYPTVTSAMRLRKLTEPSDRSQLDLSSSYIPTNKPVTGQITFNAGEIGIMTLYSKVLAEDAGLSVADMTARTLARDGAKYIDDILLNGDESATATNISHYGTDPTGTVWDAYLTLDGLRHIAIGNSDSAATATIGADSILTVQALMGARGIIGLDLPNLVCIVDPGVYYKLLAVDSFETMEKVGDRATLLTGQIGFWRGVPVVVSDELEYTNASGQVEDSHDGDKGQILVMHRPSLMVGYRRGVEVESSMPPHTGLFAMSMTVRMDLQSMEAGSVGYGYNATV